MDFVSLCPPTGRLLPFSLRNVYRELHEDLRCQIPNNGYLETWARQDMLMLNKVLTVRAHQANSHQGCGWEQFTDRVIELVVAKHMRMVFVLLVAASMWSLPVLSDARRGGEYDRFIFDV